MDCPRFQVACIENFRFSEELFLYKNLTHKSYEGFRDITMLSRSGRGRNFGGILSQVTRPIITAFFASGSVNESAGMCVVTCLKNAMSFGIRQGNVLSIPMPYSSVAATIRVKLDISSRGRNARPIRAAF